MKPTYYCLAFSVISGLSASLYGWQFWSITFLVVASLPHLKYLNYLRAWGSLFLYVMLMGICYIYGHYIMESNISYLNGEETNFSARPLTEPRKTSSGQSLSFQAKLKHGEKIHVFLPYEEKTLKPALNDECKFKGKLSPPKTARNPYSFNYSSFLREQNIYWTVTINPNTLVCKEGNNNWLHTLKKWRSHAVYQLTYEKDEEASALIAALVFGDRSLFSEQRLNQFRQLGIIHLLAVSGLHIGLVTAVLYYLLYRIGMTREKAAYSVLAILPVYALIAGGAPSVVRASLTCMFVILSVQFKWRFSLLDILSIVCITLLIINPFYLYHLGFQLSFLTSFSLLLSKRIFLNSSPFFSLLKVTGVAQLISLPLMLYHFYEISLLSLLINMLFIPFVSLWVLPISFITMFLQLLSPPAASFTYTLLSQSLKPVYMLVDIIAKWTWPQIVTGQPSEALLLAMIVSIILCLVLWEVQKKKWLAVVGCCSLLLVTLPIILPYFNGKTTVTILDVGQGDAIVIELPYRNGVYLIDTGGVIRWEDDVNEDKEKAIAGGPGKNVIEPFLKAKGISHIDRLILTHGHLDHLGETCYLTEVLTIDDAFYPIAESVPQEAKNQLMCLHEKNIPIIQVEKGVSWNVGDDSFFVMHPHGDEIDENDRSIVLFANLSGISFLFTGDLEEGGEKRLLTEYPALKVDILKVGHHGSGTSTREELLEQLKPKIGVISVGGNNTFGHPHPDVLTRLENHQVTVFRTDIHGAITIEFEDNSSFTIDHYLK
ncbi:DNA internalization-related competence protein ComEC/Rec2 [Bacillus sp. A116_S68]|nr:DNA internalization-related competence protein ComEC/Rec2 [Bacillus sp. A116_S68]